MYLAVTTNSSGFSHCHTPFLLPETKLLKSGIHDTDSVKTTLQIRKLGMKGQEQQHKITKKRKYIPVSGKERRAEVKWKVKIYSR